MNLAELEKLAKAADADAWANNTADTLWDEVSVKDWDFIHAASPDLVLRMCAALRDACQELDSYEASYGRGGNGSDLLARHGLELE